VVAARAPGGGAGRPPPPPPGRGGAACHASNLGLHLRRARRCARPPSPPPGPATHFFLSMSGMSLFSAFSTITCGPGAWCQHVPAPEAPGRMHAAAPLTGMRSGYLSRMRAASAMRFSAGQGRVLLRGGSDGTRHAHRRALTQRVLLLEGFRAADGHRAGVGGRAGAGLPLTGGRGRGGSRLLRRAPETAGPGAGAGSRPGSPPASDVRSGHVAPGKIAHRWQSSAASTPASALGSPGPAVSRRAWRPPRPARTRLVGPQLLLDHGCWAGGRALRGADLGGGVADGAHGSRSRTAAWPASCPHPS